MYTVHGTCIHGILYNVQCTLYILHGILYNVQCTLYMVHGYMVHGYMVHGYMVYYVHCTMKSVHSK